MRCPNCNRALEPEAEEARPVERCARCAGVFIGQRALRDLLFAQAATPSGTPMDYQRPSPAADAVRYRPCPACCEPMLRRNFLETSGVIVDVCGPHGVWLDRGELEALTAFAR